MAKVFIIGNKGFVGRALTTYLRQNLGHEVRGADKEDLQRCPPRKDEVVVDTAAMPGIEQCERYPADALHQNVLRPGFQVIGDCEQLRDHQGHG